MGTKERAMRTSMTAAECAAVFQDAAADARGLSAKVTDRTLQATGKNESRFFTPSGGDDPFAAVNGNRPDFEVWVLIRKFTEVPMALERPFPCTYGTAGHHREVTLYSPRDFSGSSRSGTMIDKFAGTFRQADLGLKTR